MKGSKKQLSEMSEVFYNKIYVADARVALQGIPTESVDMYCTSPPYLRQRHYRTKPVIWGGLKDCAHQWVEVADKLHAGRGDAQRSGKYSKQMPIPDTKIQYSTCKICSATKNELGLETDADSYVRNLVEVFRECKRTLKKTGTLWVVIGDKRLEGKRWALTPQRLQIAMEDDGWIPCLELIWEKSNPLPTSSNGMFKPDFEKILVFAKTPDYYLDKNAVKIPLSPVTIKRNQYAIGSFNNKMPGGIGVHSRDSPTKKKFISEMFAKVAVEAYKMPKVGGEKHAGHNGNSAYSGKEVYNHDGLRHLGSVWTISTQARWRMEYCSKCDVLRDKKGMYKRCEDCHTKFADDEDVCKKCKGTVKELCCLTCNSVIHRHFAVYPEALIEPMVRSGSPRWVCPQCDAPFINTYTEERIDTRPGRKTGNAKSGTPSDPNKGLHNSEMSKKRQLIVRHPAGERQSCKCKLGSAMVRKRAVVGDPFLGFGTTLAVAFAEGRDAFGVELDPLSARTAELRTMPILARRVAGGKKEEEFNPWHP